MQLRVGIGRIEGYGLVQLTIGRIGILKSQVREGKLVMRRRKPGIDLQGVAKFNDRFLIFAGFEIAFSALQIFHFLPVGVGGTGHQQERSCDQDSRPLEYERFHHHV